MKKILGLLLLIISVNVFGQNPTNYQYRTVRERLIASMVDSSFHIPRYNGSPVGLRVGSSTQAGALALDTINHIQKFYSGGIWRDNQPIKDGLFSGGIVTWDSLLVFTVSAAVYYIGGQRYESPITHITLDAANGSNPRIDLIVLNTSGADKITGTAASDPAEPSLPIDNIRLTAIYVNTSATTPTGPIIKIIYDENTEFTGSATSVTTDFANTADPFHFVKATSAGAVTSSSHVDYTGSDFKMSPFNTFKFFVKLKAAFAAGTRFQITWFRDGKQVSTTLSISSGTYGFIRTTGTYQEITIPVSDFAFNTDTVDQVRFSLSGSNASGFYLDYVQLKGGVALPTTGTRFGVSGEDGSATQARYFNAHNIYPFWMDSIPSLVFTAVDTRFKKLSGADWMSYTTAGDTILFSKKASYNGNIHSTFYPYSLVDKSYVDSLVAAGGSTPGIDDVLSVNQTLTTNQTIDGQGNYLRVTSNGGSPSSTALVAENSSTGSALQVYNFGDTRSLVNLSFPSADNIITYPLSLINDHAPGTDDGAGIGMEFRAATLSNNGGHANSVMGKLSYHWNETTDATRKSYIRMAGVNAGVDEMYMEIQPRHIIVNDGADSLATLADVRAGGGGSGISAADLPLRVTGSNVSADTSVVYDPSLTTNARLQKIIDSLQAAGWGAQIPASDPWYSMKTEYGMWGGGSGFDDADFQTTSQGSGSSATGQSSGLFAGWMGGVKFSTGTTNTGAGLSYFSNGSSAFAQIVMDSLIRTNVGSKVRVDTLSTADRYLILVGLADHSTAPSGVVDGVFFRYTDSDSSGKWIMCVYNNSQKKEVATSTTVAIDTDYELEVSVYKGVGYFYINDVLVGTVTPTFGMPYGTTRGTGVTVGIAKTAGTITKNMWVDWTAYGTKKN